MAERIEDFPTPIQERKPWDEWTDGSTWRLERGEDYPAEVRVNSKTGKQINPTDDFRNRLYTQAARRKLSVRTKKLVEDGKEFLIFCFYGHGSDV